MTTLKVWERLYAIQTEVGNLFLIISVSIKPEGDHLHILQSPQDGDIVKIGAPAAELPHIGQVTNSGPRHDHLLC